MNYLAHLALANNTDASLVGNLLGDFAKGTEGHLRKLYPSELVDGMMMHRAIDRFTDNHPLFIDTKQWIDPSRRKFAGIVIDIFLDHFLWKHWKTFYEVETETFIDRCYTTIDNHTEWHIGRFPEAYRAMKRQDWLRAYRTKEGIELTLYRVSHHGKHTAPIADCYEDFITQYEKFDCLFLAMYPELLKYAGTQQDY